MPNLPRFSVGDLVRPVNKVRRRKASPRILGVVVDVTHIEGFSKYGADYYSYAVHFMASDVVSVGWAEHSLEPL
jgi:hypothetical protein